MESSSRLVTSVEEVGEVYTKHLQQQFNRLELNFQFTQWDELFTLELSH